MSAEKSPIFDRGLSVVALTALAVSALGGDVRATDKPESPNPIVRCYEKPQPPPPGPDPNAPRVHLQETNGVMSGDPQRISAAAETALRGALVTVRTSLAATGAVKESSGFIADGGFLITNAHAVLDNGYAGTTGNLDAITITDASGTTVGAKGGCFIYESSSWEDFPDPPKPPEASAQTGPVQPAQSDPNFRFNPEAASTDMEVAVLVPTQPLGQTTLSLTPRGPERGQWDTVASLSGSTDGSITSFNAVALGPMQESADHAYFYATGVQPFRHNLGELDYGSPGFSGSPVVTIGANNTPTVDGIITGGYPRGTLGQEHFSDLLGCDITPFNENYIKADFVIPSGVIQNALAAIR